MKDRKNPMLEPMIEKVVVNVCVGKSGEPLEKAMKILSSLVGQKPVKIKAKKTIRGFGITKGEPIACKVTLRKGKAYNFLKKALEAVGNRLSEENFDEFGNFSFGIREHLDIPGTTYVSELGTIGMDVCVSITRKGWRVVKRRRARSKIGRKHRLTKEESMNYVRKIFGVEIR